MGQQGQRTRKIYKKPGEFSEFLYGKFGACCAARRVGRAERRSLAGPPEKQKAAERRPMGFGFPAFQR
jgi:hypothetical protein